MNQSVVILVLAFTVRLWSVSPDEHPVASFSLRAPGPVSDVQSADLNGDGRLDLIVVHETDSLHPEWMVSVYPGNAEGFGSMPSASFRTDAAVFDLTDLDGDSAKELVLLEEKTVRRIDWNNGTPSEQRIKLDFSATIPSGDVRPTRWPLAVYADEDGRDELAVPKSDGIVLMRIDSMGVVHPQLLWTGPVSMIDDRMPLKWTTEAPKLSAIDFNGDGQSDLVSTLSSRLDVFLMNLSGTSTGNSDHILNPLLPDFRYRFAYHGLDSDILKLDPEEVRLDVLDLDSDGLADVIVSRRSRLDLTNRMSAVRIHFNKHGRIDPVPDQVIAVENLGASCATGDWNRDGKIDLAIPRLNVGIEQAALVLLTRKAKAAIDLYCLGEDNRYPDDPDASIRFDAKPMIESWMRDGFASAACGDWNGDGKADLFVESGNSKRFVFPQQDSLQFDQEPIELPSSDHSVMADLNRDGADELLLWDDNSSEIRIIKHSAQ